MKIRINSVLIALVLSIAVLSGILTFGLLNIAYPEPVNLKHGLVTVQESEEGLSIVESVMQSVVAVYCPSIDIPASGFYIGDGVIVTAGHVAGVGGIEKVVFEGGAEYPILDSIVHPDYDCGLLIIDVIDKPALEFDSDGVERGETIFVLGNPNGMTFIVTKGVVSGKYDFDGFFGDIQMLVSDAAGQSGSSGSVVIDADGGIIGVWVGGSTSRCGSFLVGTGAIIGVDHILLALDAAELQRPILERNE